uniref:CEP209_CC5 domain-containing protein n=1 Tax=Macrostomum lignano TaxID=282301 RepID=A0A1I8HZ69_9PLAT
MVTLDDLRKIDPGTVNPENVKSIVDQINDADGTEGGADADKELDLLNENERLNKEVESLQSDIRKKEQDISKLTGENEDLENKRNSLEQKLSEVESENRSLSSRLTTLQERIDRTEKSQETKYAISDLNQKVRQLKTDLDLALQGKAELQEKLEKVQKELLDGAAEYESFCARYQDMKAYVDEKDTEAANATGQIEVLRQQVQELQDEIAMLRRDDDNIMNAVNEKVEEWRKHLADKDDELRRAEQEVRELRSRLGALSVDASKEQLAKLQQRLQERDTTIDELRQELSEGTDECNRVKAMLEQFQLDQAASGNTMVSRQADRIGQLLKENQGLKQRLEEGHQQALESEKASRELEEKNEELVNRNDQIVAGVFGLKEAVDETKAKERELEYCRRMIEDYVRQINKLHDDADNLRIENSMMRERLGIAPDEVLDTTAHRRAKAVQQEEDSATIMVLQKEIESLEDERMRLKWQVKSLAKQCGGQAAQMGLSGNLMVLESFVEAERAGGVHSGIDEMIQPRMAGSAMAAAPGSTMLSSRGGILEPETARTGRSVAGGAEAAGLRQELSRAAREFEEQEKKVCQLQTQNENLSEENRVMESALKEIKDGMENRKAGSLECPSLDKFLAALEAKKVMGDIDASSYLKTRLDHLQGRYDEVRAELRESRAETAANKLQLDKTRALSERLQADLDMVRNVGAASKTIFSLNLPENMTQTSQEVINSLTEQLVQALAEAKKRKEEVSKLDQSLQHFRAKFAVARHQQSLLYAEHLRERTSWSEEKTRLNQRLDELKGERQEDAARLSEFDRLLDTLAQKPEEQARRMVETTRQVTLLRCNEAALVRRFTALQEAEKTLRRENGRLKSEFTEMEKAVTERLGYYRRFKETAAFKVNSLQKALADCVPRDDLDRLQRKLDELTEKYRDFLEKNNSLVHKAETLDTMEMELRQLRLDNETLKKALTVEKEKRHLLEATMEELSKRGVDTGVTEQSQVAMSKKLSMLEMKELNERERADHASQMYESQKLQLQQLDARNRELEEKFAELTTRVLEAQKTERELRDSLATCVTKEASDRDRQRISTLEEAELKLKQEVERLRELSDIALSQSKTFREQQVSQEKELTSLRQQLLDFQCQSDERAVIGRLHRHIVQLQLSETTALRKLEDAFAKSRRSEAQMLRLEQRVDERDETLSQHRLECRSRTKQLRETVSSLRSQFAGCVPLAKQERFTKTLLALQEDKLRTKRLLTEAEEQRAKAEDELLAMKTRQETQAELHEALRTGTGAKKVAEWHQRMEQLRLQELQQRRACERARQQVKHLEGVVRSQEALIGQLEEDAVRLSKDYEERQLLWEQREAELERVVTRMESAGSEIAGTAKRLGEATASDVPDRELPLPLQLEQAVATIKQKIKAIFDLESENKQLKSQMRELEETLKERERALIKKERAINELRLRLPATADRDRQFAAAAAEADAAAASANPMENFVEAKTLHAAQTTVASLQARLQQKEESLAKYKELLKGAQDDLETAVRRHNEEAKMLREKLSQKEELVMRQTAAQQGSAATGELPRESVTRKHLKKLHELQELLAHERGKSAGLESELREARREMETWKLSYDTAHKGFDAERAVLKEELDEEKRRCTEEVARAKQEVVEKSALVQQLREDLRRQKSENERGPSATMKNLVRKLEMQLEEKEKQQRALSKALTDLRADMVYHAEETAKAGGVQNEQERDLHRILERHTKEIADELELTKERAFRVKSEQRKLREEKEAAVQQCEELKAEVARKDATAAKLRTEKNRMEQEMEEMQKKMERIKAARRSGGADEQTKTEMEELRRKVRLLEEENVRFRQRPEKPFESDIGLSGGRGFGGGGRSGGIEEWEERKRLERTIDKLKDKLGQKQIEFDRLQRQYELTKNALDRSTGGGGGSRHGPPGRQESVSVARLTGSRLQIADADVREKNFQLEEEVSRLRYQLHTLGDEREKEALRRQVSMLEERTEELERQLRLEKPEFSVEERVAHLTKYVELLKQEKAQLEAAGNTARSSTSSTSNIRRIGESGKSTRELEEMIARLKNVVKRTEAENERLKRAPGVVSQEALQQLRQENDGLRQQLSELREQMGSRLAERYEAKERGTAKLMQDYEKLRRELQRECQSHDRTREEAARLQRELSEAGRGDTAASTLATAQFRGPEADSGKVQQLEAELASRDRTNAMLKEQLRDLAEAERQWKIERQMLLARLGEDA